MALGTPVVGTTAYSASGGTSVAPAYPSGILATDKVLLFIGQKPSTANGGTVTTPSGWTLQDSLTAAGGYGTTLGADTGNTNLLVYTKDTVTGGETGTLSVTLGTNGVSWAFMIRVPTGGGAVSFGSADGQRTTTPTSPMSIALTNGASPTAFTAGDMAIWAMCIPTDVTTPSQFSAESITATGATFNTAVELNEPDSATGNDIGGYSAYATVASGTSSTAPTVTATLAGTLTNVRGPVVLLRLREAQAISFNAESGSLTSAGQDASTLWDRAVDAGAGSLAITGLDATLTVASALQNYVIDAQPGSMALSGLSASVLADRSLAAVSGAYTLTGQTATTQATRLVDAQAGSLAITGQAATLAAARALGADAGSVSLTGQSASILMDRQMSASAGSLTLSGLDAGLIYGAADPVIDASAAAFTLTGSSASVLVARQVSAESAALVQAGQQASLLVGRSLNALAGSLSVTGFDAALTYTTSDATLDAQPGSLTVTGMNAALLCGRVVPADAAKMGLSLWARTDYVDLGYASGLDAALLRSRVMAAEPGSLLLLGQESDVQVSTAYPAPAFVKAGVVYGPGGIYTGTMVDRAGGSFMRLR